jgi:ubiquinone/menaquinone biosynthesis C-methylase UbiE
MNERIRQYWEDRAKAYGSLPAATTDDVYLRESEIRTVIQTLCGLDVPTNSSVLDVGCGDGYSTLRVAQRFPGFSFLGVDYSQGMIENAQRRLKTEPELGGRVSFIKGDVLRLSELCGDEAYDVVLTDRCLINLDSVDDQSEAIAQIGTRTKPGGFYVAIENFIEGHENMNKARSAVGVPEIPVRWHNLYFHEREFVQSVERFFAIVALVDFASSYYFATRVIYSAMCQMRGEKPDYQHDIHKLAVDLPPFGQFSPIRMAVLRRKTKHENP